MGVLKEFGPFEETNVSELDDLSPLLFGFLHFDVFT
jgi:hypothetical protein